MLLIDLRRHLFSVQGGADPSTKHQVYWNEYSDLDDSPVSWHITEVSARYLPTQAPESSLLRTRALGTVSCASNAGSACKWIPLCFCGAGVSGSFSSCCFRFLPHCDAIMT